MLVKMSTLIMQVICTFPDTPITLSSRSNPIGFAFTLKSNNLPSGDLIFRFDVVSATGVVHTTEVVKYQLSVPMVATQINFEGVTGAPTYKYAPCPTFDHVEIIDFPFVLDWATLFALASSPRASLISVASFRILPLMSMASLLRLSAGS